MSRGSDCWTISLAQGSLPHDKPNVAVSRLVAPRLTSCHSESKSRLRALGDHQVHRSLLSQSLGDEPVGDGRVALHGLRILQHEGGMAEQQLHGRRQYAADRAIIE